MRYLILTAIQAPYFTNNYYGEKFVHEIGMEVFDLILKKYTVDGETWLPIEIN